MNRRAQPPLLTMTMIKSLRSLLAASQTTAGICHPLLSPIPRQSQHNSCKSRLLFLFQGWISHLGSFLLQSNSLLLLDMLPKVKRRRNKRARHPTQPRVLPPPLQPPILRTQLLLHLLCHHNLHLLQRNQSPKPLSWSNLAPVTALGLWACSLKIQRRIKRQMQLQLLHLRRRFFLFRHQQRSDDFMIS